MRRLWACFLAVALLAACCVARASEEIDLSGLSLTELYALRTRLDEAIEAVDRYLDQVVMAGYHEVTIVHGKGTGILRAGIHQHLKKQRVVKSYRLGQYGEGEDGVTLVTLK
jgi:DNA mismatch repair protein MutS2